MHAYMQEARVVGPWVKQHVGQAGLGVVSCHMFRHACKILRHGSTCPARGINVHLSRLGRALSSEECVALG